MKSTILKWIDVFLPFTQIGGEAAVVEAGWAPDVSGEYCGRCGATVAAAAITEGGCPHCRGVSIPWHNLWRLGAYKPPLSRWVIEYKFYQSWAWGPWFGRQLASRTPVHEKSVVVPVPLHWRRLWSRGYNQARLMAEAFAKAKGIPMAPLLRRVKATRKQTSLHSHAGRKANVRGAFNIRSADLTGWTVWLIDDVKTSGATAHLCTRLLQRAGALRVNFAVAAVADPKNADFQRN